MKLPPAFNKKILLSAPRRHRDDMAQEAWLAYLEGRNPNTAARNYIAREELHEERETCFSQLSLAELEALGVL